ncbi:MAG: UDP-glucose 6-dehydrogenase, partial [Clostridiaceae bacterium]|nr:UDP-glucose 6-dehydrogenase [Clostridiaceae bacterium]
PLLLERGADIYAYDPVGMDNFKKKYPEGKNGRGSITYVENPEVTLKDANVCFVFTEWGEIQAIKPVTYKLLMRTPLVYDGRNIYKVEDMYGAGVEYYSIGRQKVNISNAISEAAAASE